MLFLPNNNSSKISANTGYTSSSNSATGKEVPNIVQLFHKRYIDFRLGDTAVIGSTNTTTTSIESNSSVTTKRIEPYHLVSYHAVEKKNIVLDDDDDDDDISNSTVLGVWNCQISFNENSNTLVERVLDQIIVSPTTHHLVLLLTLDLNEPSTVAPTINSVVPMLQKLYPYFSTDLPIFGEPPDKQSMEEEDHTAENNENASSVGTSQKIIFFFTCILPFYEPSTFKEKQIQALLTYHLHRYAFLMKSSLVFIRATAPHSREQEPTNTTTTTTTITQSSNGMDILTFTKVLHRLGVPASLVEEEEVVETTSSSEEKFDEEIGELLHRNYMFTPKDHDPTMIETTLRRNANCEGMWDVEKDSLAMILPPQQLPTTKSRSQQQQPTMDYSDDVWLSKLASSTIRLAEATSIATTTEPSKSSRLIISQEKKKTTSTTTGTTTIDPTSFFESLLKKS